MGTTAGQTLLTCTKAWTASICPVIFRFSSPSPVHKESKEHDVSMLTRQCLFRALYSTRLINRPNPYKIGESKRITHIGKKNLAKKICLDTHLWPYLSENTQLMKVWQTGGSGFKEIQGRTEMSVQEKFVCRNLRFSNSEHENIFGAEDSRTEVRDSGVQASAYVCKSSFTYTLSLLLLGHSDPFYINWGESDQAFNSIISTIFPKLKIYLKIINSHTYLSKSLFFKQCTFPHQTQEKPSNPPNPYRN